MFMSLESIHALEVREDYPRAIDELEARLAENPHESETVVRLGFNLWYAVAENNRLKKEVPIEAYAQRFISLFRAYVDSLSQNADFCWVFGLGMSLFWYYFPGASEEEGQRLLQKARTMDGFWRRFLSGGHSPVTAEEAVARFSGRGIFERYYLSGAVPVRPGKPVGPDDR